MKKLLITTLVAAALGWTFAQPMPQAAETSQNADAQRPLKVVVHVNFADAEAQGRGLENIQNIFKEVAGEPEMEVVCHGPGIVLLVKDRSKHADTVRELMGRHVRFAACRNTMRKLSLTADDLLTGVVTVASGTVEVIRKQQEGYAYFKP